MRFYWFFLITSSFLIGCSLLTSSGEVSLPLDSSIVFSEEGVIYTVSPDGSNAFIILEDDRCNEQPVWSPEGTQIAFISSTECNIFSKRLYVMNADGSFIRLLAEYGDDFSLYYPSWSPDGSKIAFQVTDWRDRDNIKTNVFIVNPYGVELEEISSSFNENIGEHTWLYDSSSIILSFTNDTESYGEAIVSIDINTGEITPIQNPHSTGFPMQRALASPVNNYIIYTNKFAKDAFPNLYLMSLDEMTPIELYSGIALELAPQWSSDGKFISFYDVGGLDNKGGLETFIINIDTLESKHVFGTRCISWDWGPSESGLFVASCSNRGTDGNALVIMNAEGEVVSTAYRTRSGWAAFADWSK